MSFERGEGGALVLHWSRASTTTTLVAACVAIVGLLVAVVIAIPRDPAALSMLAGMLAVGAVAVLVFRRAMASTWRIGNGVITREKTLLRGERRWAVAPGSEVALTHRVTSGRNAHEKWGVVVRGGGEEIHLGEKASGEPEARAIGEALARELRIPLRYGPDVTIRCEDLDLPFVERLARYPALRVEPEPRPPGIPIVEELLGTSRIFRWRALNVFTLLGVLGATLFALVYVADSPGLARLLLAQPEWAVGFVAVPLAVLLGLGFRLSAGPQGVEYQVTLYGLPLRTRSIPASELEEVRPRTVVHTPTLQLASDREIIRCRLYRWKGDTGLRWLAGEVQQALSGSLGDSRFTR